MTDFVKFATLLLLLLNPLLLIEIAGRIMALFIGTIAVDIIVQGFQACPIKS